MTAHCIGYARVSTQEQDLESQLEQLTAAGCSRIFHGKHSGAKQENQDQLDRLVEYVREGDTVLVTKLDRLGRSLKMILATLERLEAKGVAVRSLDGAVDTSNQSPAATAQRALIAVFAQLERDLIVTRTSEGREAAMQRGVKFGRKQKLTEEEQKDIKQRHQRGESVRKLAAEYGVGRPTIDRVLKR